MIPTIRCAIALCAVVLFAVMPAFAQSTSLTRSSERAEERRAEAAGPRELSESDVCELLGSAGFIEDSISKEELNTLVSGGPVFTLLEEMDEAALRAESDRAGGILDEYAGMGPNFIIESFFILPVAAEQERKVLEEVQTFLMNVEQFVGIPYWSEEQQKYYDLIGSLEVLERRSFEDGSSGILTEQKMKPFKPYESLYRYWMEDDIFIYTNTNTSPIRYKFMKAVKEGEMFTSLFVHREEGALVFYGIGGVHAFTFFGMFGDRLETSFRGRTESFFQWFHEEFVLTRLETR